MRDVRLADRIRARGVDVVEVAGWQTRGSDSFAPRGAVNHHTAGSASGAAPSLAICIYGRSDLPGPLCNVLLGRDLKAYVIAAGRANHAGRGGWKGLVGNTTVHGLEVEHVGSGSTATSKAQLKAATRIQAAFLEAPGSSRDPGLVCQHAEWAPTRKVDFRELAPYTPDTFRSAVSGALEDDMALTDEDKKWFKENFGNVIIKDSRPGVPLPANGAPLRLIVGEGHMRLRNMDARTVSIAAQLAALQSAIAQLQVEGAEVDYARVQQVAQAGADAAIRDVLGSLDPIDDE